MTTSPILPVALIAFLFSGTALVAPAHAQTSAPAGQTRTSSTTTVLAQIRALLNDNPNGGVELTRGIAALIVQNPDAAADVVALARNASPAQRTAIARGISMAIAQLGATSPAAQSIRAALAADSTMQAMVSFFSNRQAAGALALQNALDKANGLSSARGAYVPPPAPPISPN